jgi:hypothetical protein
MYYGILYYENMSFYSFDCKENQMGERFVCLSQGQRSKVKKNTKQAIEGDEFNNGELVYRIKRKGGPDFDVFPE